MKVKDLIELLETIDGDEEIYISVDGYAYEISGNLSQKTLIPAFGNNTNLQRVRVIKPNEQVGRV